MVTNRLKGPCGGLFIMSNQFNHRRRHEGEAVRAFLAERAEKLTLHLLCDFGCKGTSKQA